VGPMTLLRGLGEDMDARRDRMAEAATHVSARMTETCEWVAALPHAARPALGALAAAPRRVWVAERTAVICVLGGILTAPLLTVLACIGLIMPAGAPLHKGAETLMILAVVLLMLALVSAQAHCHRNASPEE
jgi:hypothetical protein